MLNLLIADDEPRIRNGLKNLIQKMDLGINICALAEDGEASLALAKKFNPELLIVDINMPFLNGLEFIEALNKMPGQRCVIIISGYNEFNYAQRAISLNVFSYLTKPVDEDQLRCVLENAVISLENTKKDKTFSNWAKQQLSTSFLTFQEHFFNQWISGKVTKDEIEHQRKLFCLKLPHCNPFLLLACPTPLLHNVKLIFEDEAKRMRNELHDVVSLQLGIVQDTTIYKDLNGNVLVLYALEKDKSIFNTCAKVKNIAMERLDFDIIVVAKPLEKDCSNLPEVYPRLLNALKEQGKLTPIVNAAQQFINENYQKNSLNLTEVADSLGVNPTYLSRLMKQELGITFIEYLTDIRIKQAIKFMYDSSTNIVDIASNVGYSSQHYFSVAFKKLLGISPNEYRNNKILIR